MADGLNFYVRYLPLYCGCLCGFLILVGAVPHPLHGFNTDAMMPAFMYLLAKQIIRNMGNAGRACVLA